MYLCVYIIPYATYYLKSYKEVPIVAQQVTNPTGIHEDTGLIPDLSQWVNDLALP